MKVAGWTACLPSAKRKVTSALVAHGTVLVRESVAASV